MTRQELDEAEAQIDSTVPYYVLPLIRAHRAALDKIDELRNLVRILGDAVVCGDVVAVVAKEDK